MMRGRECRAYMFIPMKNISLLPSYTYLATVLTVVDGDTIDVMVDLGFGVHVKQRMRLLGINAPEMKAETYAAGQAAKEYLERLLRKYAIDWNQSQPVVFIASKKGRTTDKYGRWLSWVTGQDGDKQTAVNINQRMIDDGFAVSYMAELSN